MTFTAKKNGFYSIYQSTLNGAAQKVVDIQPAEDDLPGGPLDLLGQPDWSPDGTTLAYTCTAGGNSDICLIGENDLEPLRLTDNPHPDVNAAWSPDGQHLAFQSYVDNDYEIFVIGKDGEDLEQVTEDDLNSGNPEWSPDGSKIAFEVIRPNRNSDVVWVNSDGSERKNLTNTSQVAEQMMSWSPDGSAFVYSGGRIPEENEKTFPHVFIKARSGDGARRLTNAYPGEFWPSWSPSGDQIAFIALSSRNEGDIVVTQEDGTNPINITNGFELVMHPTWGTSSSI